MKFGRRILLQKNVQIQLFMNRPIESADLRLFRKAPPRGEGREGGSGLGGAVGGGGAD